MYDEIEDGQIKTVDLGVEAGFAIVDELGEEMAKDAMQIADAIEEALEPPAIRLYMDSFNHETKPRMELMPGAAEKFVEIAVRLLRS